MTEKIPEYDVPDFRQTEMQEFFDYEANVIDYEKLPELNRSINATRVALYKVTDQINRYERMETEKRVTYEREHRRAYLTSTEKTEAAKKARADLRTEELENDWIAYKQTRNELARIANTLRTDLQTLQAVSNNIRQQLKM